MHTALFSHECYCVTLYICKYCGESPSIYEENLPCSTLQADNVTAFSVQKMSDCEIIIKFWLWTHNITTKLQPATVHLNTHTLRIIPLAYSAYSFIHKAEKFTTKRKKRTLQKLCTLASCNETVQCCHTAISTNIIALQWNQSAVMMETKNSEHFRTLSQHLTIQEVQNLENS